MSSTDNTFESNPNTHLKDDKKFISIILYSMDLSDLKCVGLYGTPILDKKDEKSEDKKFNYSSFLYKKYDIENEEKLINEVMCNLGFKINKENINDVFSVKLKECELEYDLKLIYVDKTEQNHDINANISWLTHIESLQNSDWKTIVTLVKRAVSKKKNRF